MYMHIVCFTKPACSKISIVVMPVALFALDAAHPRYKNLRYKKLRGEVKQRKQESRHNRTYKTENKRCKTKKKVTGSYTKVKSQKHFSEFQRVLHYLGFMGCFIKNCFFYA